MSWQLAVVLVLALGAASALVVWRERVRQLAVDSVTFLGEVRGEVQKVTWPDKLQLRNATLVILGFVALVAMLIGILDVVLQWLLVSLPGRA